MYATNFPYEYPKSVSVASCGIWLYHSHTLAYCLNLNISQLLSLKMLMLFPSFGRDINSFYQKIIIHCFWWGSFGCNEEWMSNSLVASWIFFSKWIYLSVSNKAWFIHTKKLSKWEVMSCFLLMIAYPHPAFYDWEQFCQMRFEMLF